MSRNGANFYAKPAGTTAVPQTLIGSAVFNAVVDDIAADLNLPRPIVAGGTGASTAAGARAALGVDLTVNTFSDLIALTSVQIAVGAYASVKQTGARYRRLVSGGNLAHTASPLAWEVQSGEGGYTLTHFGSVGDDLTDNTAAIASAMAWLCANGGMMFVPRGIYRSTVPIVLNTGAFDKGVIVYGEGRNSAFRITGSNQDGIHFSTTQFLQNSGLRDLRIITSATAGHCVHIVYGCTTCFFENIEFEQGNVNKSIFFGDYATFGGGVYDTVFSGGTWTLPVGATKAGVRFNAAGTLINGNVFRNIRAYNAQGEQFFKITSSAGSGFWLNNNTIEHINFEVCSGGGIYLDSAKGCRISDVSFWDTAAYTGHLIHLAAGTGYESIGNTISQANRHGDVLLGGAKDIYIQSGQDTLIDTCYTQASDAPAYDLGGKRAQVHGKLAGTVTNGQNATYLNSIEGFKPLGSPSFLDYFGQGTFTATLTATTTAPTVAVTATCQWQRIGRRLTVNGVFDNVSTAGAAGNVKITGLPVICGAAAGLGQIALLGIGTAPACAVVAASTTEILILSDTTLAAIPIVAGTGKTIYFNVSYDV